MLEARAGGLVPFDFPGPSAGRCVVDDLLFAPRLRARLVVATARSAQKMVLPTASSPSRPAARAAASPVVGDVGAPLISGGIVVERQLSLVAALQWCDVGWPDTREHSPVGVDCVVTRDSGSEGRPGGSWPAWCDWGDDGELVVRERARVDDGGDPTHQVGELDDIVGSERHATRLVAVAEPLGQDREPAIIDLAPASEDVYQAALHQTLETPATT